MIEGMEATERSEKARLNTLFLAHSWDERIPGGHPQAQSLLFQSQIPTERSLDNLLPPEFSGAAIFSIIIKVGQKKKTWTTIVQHDWTFKPRMADNTGICATSTTVACTHS